MQVNLLLFDNFETLDLFGPIEILGRIESYQLRYVSLSGGTVTSAQGAKIFTESVTVEDFHGILLVPGGRGTRPLVNDDAFLLALKKMADAAKFCLSVCTGAALLGKCGALNGRQATSNKKALDWAKSMSEKVRWIDRARWVVDGKFYTSSGVSAGMDMALGFVCDRFGRAKAEEIAAHIEYLWNDDCRDDRFAR